MLKLYCMFEYIIIITLTVGFLQPEEVWNHGHGEN